jgi:sodium/potassium-transporting ATPase subunit alpha
MVITSKQKAMNGEGKPPKEKKKKEDLRQEMETDNHVIPLSELYVRLETDPDKGITTEMATERLHRDGPNALTPPKQTPEIIKFLREFFSPFSLVLWAGAILCFIAYGIQLTSDPVAPLDNVYVGIVLIVVVVISGIFSYYQESKSSKIMDSFKKMIPPQACVILMEKKQKSPVLTWWLATLLT